MGVGGEDVGGNCTRVGEVREEGGGVEGWVGEG